MACFFWVLFETDPKADVLNQKKPRRGGHTKLLCKGSLFGLLLWFAELSKEPHALFRVAGARLGDRFRCAVVNRVGMMG